MAPSRRRAIWIHEGLPFTGEEQVGQDGLFHCRAALAEVPWL